MERQYVGIDLHRRRSVIVRRTEAGETLEYVRIDNDDSLEIARQLALAGPNPEVVVEATYGWYWLIDFLQSEGARVHLAHPLGNNWGNRRVKNDRHDAEDLVDLLRLGRLAESWIAPPEVRELRELVRYRAKLVALRSGLKAQVHAVLAKEGVKVPMTDLFGRAGTKLMDGLSLAPAYERRVASLRDLIATYDEEVGSLEAEVGAMLGDDPGYRAIQVIPGVGPVFGAIFVVEVGEVTRFPSPDKLCCWAGLTPRHRESDTSVYRGSITKQGSRLVRWAAIEAAQRQSATFLKDDFARIATRRENTKVARVAVARKILTLVYYGLRDHEVRCLAEAG
jgi:transposase